MTVGELRKLLEGLPDDMEVIGESWSGQKDMLCGEVCTHELDGLHYSEKEAREARGFDPKESEKLEKPTFKLTIRY